MIQPLLIDMFVVGTDDLKNYDRKYGILVRRVMKVVGQMLCSSGHIEGLFEKFLEAMIIDCEEGNKIHEMTCRGLQLHQSKFEDRHGILSKSFPELEIKLSLFGGLNGKI